jgi:outer membrane beta-barrel protein
MKTLKIVIIFFTVVLLPVPHAFCADTLDGESVAAVQDRVFFRYHEIDLGVGYIPDDDFYELFPIEIGYTFSFNDQVAWNVVDVHWIHNQEKDLKTNLEQEFGVTPENFDHMVSAIHSNIVYKPFYGKSVYRNNKVINHETYVFAGGGMVNYEMETSDGSTESDMRPSISLGIGKKFFIGQKLCLNVELRDWINFNQDELDNHFWVGVTIGYRFNLSPRQSQRDTTMEKVSQYLE